MSKFKVGDFVYRDNLHPKNVGYVIEIVDDDRRYVDMRVMNTDGDIVEGHSDWWNNLEERYEMYRRRWQNFRTALLNIAVIQLIDARPEDDRDSMKKAMQTIREVQDE